MVLFLFIPLCGQHQIVHAESIYVKDYYGKDKNQKTTTKSNISPKDTQVNSDSSSPVISFWDVTKMIFALILVIALLYYLLKFINKKSRSYQQNRFVQNFGGTSLGGNRSLQIVKAGKRILILGVGEDIRLLKEIEDQQEIDDFMKQYEEQTEHSIEPKDIVSKIAKRINGYKKNVEGSQPSFQNLLKEQLLNIKKDRKNMIKEFDKKEKNSDE
ncbi:flagellar biosynthetic protein FliO [Bacillus sp. FJAT-49736]|nr:flagellar biosynthetic protein FliO [Bacillus sp. FJAT-49736]